MLVLLVQSVLHKNQPDHNNLFFPLLEFVDIEFVGLEFVGIELVDSGDFYYAFMYLVFLGFSLRPLLTSIDYNDSFRNIFSIKLFINFYLNLIYYFFKRR